MVSSLHIVREFVIFVFLKHLRPPILITLDVLRQLFHPGITLHLGTDEVEHLVVPALQMQRFVLQLTDEIEHQPVQIRINRQPGNLIQPLAGQCQIGVAIGIE